MDSINRTFIGVRVPPELLPVVDRSLLMLKRKPGILDVRWNQPSEYVLNMVTLGELSVATIARLREAIEGVTNQHPPFELTLEKFGGVPFLGVDGISIVGHGRSSSRAIKNMIYMAEHMIERRVNEHIAEVLSEN